MNDRGFTVHLCPPNYPVQLHPFRCRHEPQFQMMAGARSVEGRIELDSPMCMACGRPLPGTHGNALVCIAECYDHLGMQAQIGRQLVYLRGRYLRLALRLFDEAGWRGKHRKWAELIDPNLTMRVERRGAHLAAVFADNSYFSKPEEAA